MRKFSKLLLLTVTLCISGCFAPKPTKISFTGKMLPINFNDGNSHNNNIVIKSEQISNFKSQKFVYSIDEEIEYSPEFFYYIVHADKIVARIKPPFVEFVFDKVKANLRNYGVTASIEFFIDEEDDENNSQVVLECIIGE